LPVDDTTPKEVLGAVNAAQLLARRMEQIDESFIVLLKLNLMLDDCF
jgi:hypothetical protein